MNFGNGAAVERQNRHQQRPNLQVDTAAAIEDDLRKITLNCKQLIVKLRDASSYELMDIYRSLYSNLQDLLSHYAVPNENALLRLSTKLENALDPVVDEVVRKVTIQFLQELTVVKNSGAKPKADLKVNRSVAPLLFSPAVDKAKNEEDQLRQSINNTKIPRSISSNSLLIDHYANDEDPIDNQAISKKLSRINERFSLVATADDHKLVRVYLEQNGVRKEVHAPNKDLDKKGVLKLFNEQFGQISSDVEVYMQQPGQSSLRFEDNTAPKHLLQDGIVFKLQSSECSLNDLKSSMENGFSDLMKEVQELRAALKATSPSFIERNLANGHASPVTVDKKKSLKQAKSEYKSLRKSFKNFQDRMKAEINQKRVLLHEKVEIVTQSNQSTPKDKQSSRLDTVASMQESIKKELNSLIDNYNELSDEIEEIKKDVVDRGSYPAERIVLLINKQLQSSSSQLQSLNASLSSPDTPDSYKSQWKSIWEAELSKVVKQQSNLKELEAASSKMLTDYDVVSEVWKQILKFLELKKETGHIRTFEVKPKEEFHEGLNTVLQELLIDCGSPENMLSPDSPNVRRLKAVEKMEKQRRKYTDLQRDELRDEIKERKESLNRRPGGIEEIERLRREKTSEILKIIYINSNTTNSQEK